MAKESKVVIIVARRKRKEPRFKRCNRNNHRIIPSELEAKIALANRQRKDKGEIRIFRCGTHWHLTSQDQKTPWE